METVFNQSLGGGEAFSAVLSMKPISQVIVAITRGTRPPLWNICEHFVFKVFGAEEVYIRSLSFVFSVGTVFFVFKIASHFFGKKTALFASLLTLLNPFFFFYAFEGGPYSIVNFGVAGSMYFFLTRAWKRYTFFTLWALYSHYLAVFILLAQGVWFLYEHFFGERKIAKKTFKYFLLVGLGYTPWIIPLIKQFAMAKNSFWPGGLSSEDFVYMIFDYLAEGIKVDLYIPFLEIKLYKLSLILIFLTLVLRNWLKNFKSTLFFLSWFLTPIILTYLISEKFMWIFHDRYLFYTIPGAMLLIATNKRGVASYITLILIIITYGIIDLNHFVYPAKLPFREYAAYVKSVSDKREILINWNSNDTHHLWESKYYDISGPIYLISTANPSNYFETAIMEDGDIIKSVPEEINSIGVVTSGAAEEVKIPNYVLLEVKEFSKLKYILLVKEKTNDGEE